MSTQNNDTSTMYLRTIPTEVKKQFKIYCASNGVSMTEKVVELMKQACESDTSNE